MSWAQGRTLHTTRTGRAKPRGKTTRRSLSIKGTKYAKGAGQDRPLGFERMCHPQALTRTPLHPSCNVDKSQYNIKHLLDSMTALDFIVGFGLVRTRKAGLWRVRYGKRTIGFAECHDALAYRNAARHFDVTLEVYDG